MLGLKFFVIFKGRCLVGYLNVVVRSYLCGWDYWERVCGVYYFRLRRVIVVVIVVGGKLGGKRVLGSVNNIKW